MALREIIKKGDPVLEKHCHPVTRFDQKLWDLLDDMRETLAQANGLGLAWVKVRAYDRNGNEFETEGTGMTARCFCHELAHLDGQLYTDLADRIYTTEELDAMLEEQGK